MTKEKSKKELTEEAQDFLLSQRVMVLSTVDPDGGPHAATVFYYLRPDRSFVFYFFSHSLTQKSQNLKMNNRAALTIFTQIDPVIVQAKGIVMPVEDEKEANMAISKLTDISVTSSQWYSPPISKIKAGELKVFKVKVDWLRYADFRGLTGTPPPFHQIIP